MKKGITYCIYRYNSEKDQFPYIQRWYIPKEKKFSMLLDVLFYLKDNKDQGFSFRRSCREGICGSCAMNINGTNGLACITRNPIEKEKVLIYPLPHMPVIKDLVVCMKHFYEQYRSINPFIQEYSFFDYEIDLMKINNKLQNNFWVELDAPKKENYQSKKTRSFLDGYYECILCACCSTSCPSYWWNRDKYLGPAVLLQSYRWIMDTRDDYLVERVSYLNDTYRLYRCHLILNCTHCCPKKLNPAKAISNIRNLVRLT